MTWHILIQTLILYKTTTSEDKLKISATQRVNQLLSLRLESYDCSLTFYSKTSSRNPMINVTTLWTLGNSQQQSLQKYVNNEKKMPVIDPNALDDCETALSPHGLTKWTHEQRDRSWASVLPQTNRCFSQWLHNSSLKVWNNKSELLPSLHISSGLSVLTFCPEKVIIWLT